MGVDLSDQLIQYFETRRRARKYWKTLFFIVLTCYKCLHFVSTSRRKKYDHRTFVTELIKDLASYYNSSTVNMSYPAHRPTRSDLRAPHRLQFQETYANYAACKIRKRPYNKTNIVSHVTFRCFTHTRDCFSEWHSPSFDGCRNK